MRCVQSGHWPPAYLYTTVLTDASAASYHLYGDVRINDQTLSPGMTGSTQSEAEVACEERTTRHAERN